MWEGEVTAGEQNNGGKSCRAKLSFATLHITVQREYPLTLFLHENELKKYSAKID